MQLKQTRAGEQGVDGRVEAVARPGKPEINDEIEQNLDYGSSYVLFLVNGDYCESSIRFDAWRSDDVRLDKHG